MTIEQVIERIDQLARNLHEAELEVVSAATTKNPTDAAELRQLAQVLLDARAVLLAGIYNGNSSSGS